MHTMKILIIAWVTVVFTACGSQDADQKIITAVNPLDGERYIWIPPGTFHMGCSAKDRDCQDGQIQAFNNEQYNTVNGQGEGYQPKLNGSMRHAQEVQKRDMATWMKSYGMLTTLARQS